MQIQINSDNNLEVRQAFADELKAEILDKLRRYRDQVSRVEVQLSDVNAARTTPSDKRCLMEARVDGLAAVAVTHDAQSLRQSVQGATDKLLRAIDNALGRAGRA
jgi:ribosome-associated translation inhibitor RaiA